MQGPGVMRLALLLLLFLLASPAPGLAAEVIHSFDSHVSLAKDGELTVTERIRVRAEGSSIKRGIYRDFPLTFTDARGRRREVSFKLLEVIRDGKPEPYFTERKSGGVIRIYAGDKDVLLAHGDYTYVFRYRTSRQARWFDGKPELNWNVTGNFWTFPILAASYRLELADRLRPTQWTAFTGPLGVRGTDFRGGITSEGALVVNITRPLQPGEGLTVAAALPEGAVAPPTRANELWHTFVDNRAWILGGLGFVLVLGYYLAAWNAVGRDPKRGTIIPLFYPPKGISPALANYIENWGLSRDKWRAFTAAALSLAVKGLVRFDDSSGTLTLKSTGRQPEGGIPALPPGERAIATWLNSWGGSAKIDRANGAAVANVARKFTDAVEGENRNRFFRRNLGYVVAGMLMTAAVIIGILVFGGLGETDTFIIVFTTLGSVWLGALLVPVMLALLGAMHFVSIVRAALTLVVLGIFASIAAQILQGVFADGFGDMLPSLWALLGDHPFPIALLASFAALNGLFLYLMRAPTALGRPIMDQLAGFKLYLETAESARLNLGAPEITAERFEALLPYAVALHVEEPWSEAFAAALKRAYPGEADRTGHYRPAWHSGSWSGRSFGSAVTSTVASTVSALSSAMPVSSSSSGFSSGGGGSGGGGGGGGGGGW
jgi:hypothetical protein